MLFLPNLDITANRIKDVPDFYQKIIKHWSEISQSPPQTPFMVLSESLWFNSFIKIDNMSISPWFCVVNQSIFMCDLFTDNGNFITLDAAPIKLNTLNPFKWIQIMNAIPVGWTNIVQGTHITRGSCCLDIHLNKKENIISIYYIILLCLDSKELYELFINKVYTLVRHHKDIITKIFLAQI